MDEYEILSEFVGIVMRLNVEFRLGVRRYPTPIVACYKLNRERHPEVNRNGFSRRSCVDKGISVDVYLPRAIETCQLGRN